MSESIADRFLKSQRLPTPPATALRILELANKDDTSTNDIAEAVAADPSLSARLLKYANSPIIGPRQEIASIRQAVVVLGIRAVKVAALGFSLVKKRTLSHCPHFDFDLFWAYATAAATAARGIVSSSHRTLSEEAFVAGLLSRIGKLAFATAIPEDYESVLASLGSVLHDGTAEEKVVLGADNVEVGAALLARWKLPSLLVDAVRFQSTPDQAPSREARILANAVCRGRPIANALCGMASKSDPRVVAAVAELNLDELENQFRGLAGVFDLSLDQLPESDEIEERARDLVDEIAVATQTETTVIQAMNEELVKQTLLDPLTGINNRRALDQRLASELERSRRYRRPLSLLMIDIDRFKALNDTHGHVVGDVVLKRVAQRVVKTVRGCDFAARYGGEEFVIIAAETDGAAAAQLAERIRQAIHDEPVLASHGGVPVTVSIGAASIEGGDQLIEPADLITAADQQLYQAKRAGRNCCRQALFGANASPVPAAPPAIAATGR